MIMNEKVLKILEYDKILHRLASYASSDAGKSLCLALQPMTDANDINTAQRQTTDAVLRLRRKSAPHYQGLKDILPSLKRLEIDATLSCKDLLEISISLDVAASVISFIKPERDDEPADSLSYLADCLIPCSELNTEIKRCIVSYDEIADNASPALKNIRMRMAQAGSKIQSTLNALVTSQAMKTYLQDCVVTMRGGRYCIPVKLEHKNHVPGLVHDQSGSGATVFIEPMSVVKLNNELKELSIEEAAEIQAILTQLSVTAAVYRKDLENNYKLLSELDLILAKARYSEALRCNAPSFNDHGRIDLKKARHPLLDQKKAVPVDIRLGGEYHMLIITGPNTGGKTVSLKTTGLLQLMGQSGMHIPAADGSELAIFDEIWADIGDEQSIEQNLSTFSSHMTNLVRILDKADSSSLVLLDELCSGTDPAQGAALAQSILSRILMYGADCMATTHYSELKVFAINTKDVQNASCQFDMETLQPTYKLLIGLPGKSNAFEIAEKLGLDTYIINDARSRIDEGSVAFEDLLADIETDKRMAEIERADAERLKAQAAQIKAKYEKDAAALEDKKENIINEARTEAYDILQQAKDSADRTIRELRKSSKSGISEDLERIRTAAGKNAKDALAKTGRKASTAHNEPASKTLKDCIRVGMPLKIRSMNVTGTVTSLPGQGDLVGIQMGSMSMKVKLSDLQALSDDEMALYESEHGGGKSKKGAASAAHIQYAKALGVSGEIKLLGLNVDEAMLELDKYIDDACMANLRTARIVHGKGTGALRNAVREKLKKDKRVRSFKQAEYGEGDAGVTVVEFK